MMKGSGTQVRRSTKRKSVRDQSGAGKLKIGELLSKAGYITPTQLDHAKKVLMKEKNSRLGNILYRLEYIDADTVFNFLSRQNYPPVHLEQEVPSPEALKLLPFEQAREFMAFPLRVAGKTLQITMAEPCNTRAIEELQELVARELSICVSAEKDIAAAYSKYYAATAEDIDEILGNKTGELEEELDVTEIDDFGSIVAEAADNFEIEADNDDIASNRTL